MISGHPVDRIDLQIQGFHHCVFEEVRIFPKRRFGGQDLVQRTVCKIEDATTLVVGHF